MLVFLIPAGNNPKMAPNFAYVVDTGNASFAAVNDPSNACIAGIVDTRDVPSESLRVPR